MFGFLPPSSRESFLKCGAAACWIRSAVTQPPVKDMAGTRGCATSAWPAVAPQPKTMFTTPGGMCTAAQASHSMRAVIEVISLGLHTTVLPTVRVPRRRDTHQRLGGRARAAPRAGTVGVPAMAGAILKDSRYSGRFHGEIKPQTPTGDRCT